MTRHDQELLAKQLWAATSPPRDNTTIIGLMIVAVFFSRHRHRRYSV
jgi:hypothetical protein